MIQIHHESRYYFIRADKMDSYLKYERTPKQKMIYKFTRSISSMDDTIVPHIEVSNDLEAFYYSTPIDAMRII